MKRIQIVPKQGINLYGRIVAKEVALNRREGKNKSTFYRTSKKERGRAKWGHTEYWGWVNIELSLGGLVVVEVRTKAGPEEEWKLFHAFMGYLDRHFRDDILAINIQYD